jgi:hypothetical protein
MKHSNRWKRAENLLKYGNYIANVVNLIQFSFKSTLPRQSEKSILGLAGTHELPKLNELGGQARKAGILCGRFFRPRRRARFLCERNLRSAGAA